jgi:putative transposase
LRQHLGDVFRSLAVQKESRIEEGHLMADHVHMMVALPPKYAVSQGNRVYQGEECDSLGAGVRREHAESRRNLVGQHFWARGYFVSTVGRDEEMIREYIRKQEEQVKRLDQMRLWR